MVVRRLVSYRIGNLPKPLECVVRPEHGRPAESVALGDLYHLVGAHRPVGELLQDELLAPVALGWLAVRGRRVSIDERDAAIDARLKLDRKSVV